MRASSRSKVLLGGFAAVIVLGIAGSLLYGTMRRHSLESSAAAGVADATARLREAAGVALDAPQAEARLRAHEAALGQHLERLRAEDLSRNRALAEAAELYLVDVQSILRVQANTARALGASRASRRALAAHMERAEGRGAGWIERALALKQRAERDNFEYRTAAGALAALYYGHRETQEKVRAALPQAPLLDEQARARLQQAAKDAEAAAEQELGELRRLPLG